MKLKTVCSLAAAVTMLTAIGCAPQYLMIDNAIIGDHYVRKMLKPAGSSDEQQLTHYYVEICDVGDDGKSKDCNVTMVLENLTNYNWNK